MNEGRKEGMNDVSIGLHFLRRRQRGRVVRAPDLESGGRGFKSRSEWFLGGPQFNSSVMLVNSQLVCLPPVGIFKPVACRP